MDSMAEISPEQAEKIYNQVMAGPSSPFFVRTQKKTVFINDLSELELGRTYKEYANRNLEIITEKEI